MSNHNFRRDREFNGSSSHGANFIVNAVGLAVIVIIFFGFAVYIAGINAGVSMERAKGAPLGPTQATMQP